MFIQHSTFLLWNYYLVLSSRARTEVEAKPKRDIISCTYFDINCKLYIVHMPCMYAPYAKSPSFSIILMMIRKRVGIGMVDRRQNYLLLQLLLVAWIHFFRIQQIYRMRKLWCRQFFCSLPLVHSVFLVFLFPVLITFRSFMLWVLLFTLSSVSVSAVLHSSFIRLQFTSKANRWNGRKRNGKRKIALRNGSYRNTHKSFDYDSWKRLIIKYGKPITVPFFAMPFHFPFSSVQNENELNVFMIFVSWKKLSLHISYLSQSSGVPPFRRCVLVCWMLQMRFVCRHN